MDLPRLPYNIRKAEQETVQFLGVNYTDNHREGEMADACGLTTAGFPCITQRDGYRRVLPEFDNVTDIFEWDGKIVVINDGKLYYGGKFLGNVAPGEKQFAVVNTKLCITPDNVYIDLAEEKVLPMRALQRSGLNSVTFTENGITMQGYPSPGKLGNTFSGYVYAYNHKLYDQENGCMAYTKMEWVDNKWVLTGGEQKRIDNNGVSSSPFKGRLAPGDFVPLLDTEDPRTFKLNTVMFNMEAGVPQPLPPYGPNRDKLCCRIDSLTHKETSVEWHSTDVFGTVLDMSNKNPLFKVHFKVGDRVQISGCTTLPTNNTPTEPENVYLKVTEVTDNSMTFENPKFTPGAEAAEVTITRNTPDFDFICSSQNRLWGVSNKEKTIYASALGDPTNFQVFDGVSTDSYAVAVGSEGDFTALVAYNSAVLAFKENHLHKILGSFPAEYYMADYTIQGVAPGAERSCVIINETLFYLGSKALYAYNGGTPQEIGYPLGEARYTEPAAGTDGQDYAISFKRNGVPSLMVYDTTHRLWMREDDKLYTAFANKEGVPLILTDGKIYAVGDDTEKFEWYAEFVPFTEGTVHKKGYNKIVLRMDMEPKSYVKVFVAEDRKPMRLAWQQGAREDMTVSVAVRVNRCDTFRIRIEGKGRTTIRAMARVFRVGSEVH